MDTPTNIDISKYSGAVHYQGNEGSCVPNALYNMILNQTNLSGNPFKIDCQFDYQNILNAEGFPNADHGTVLSVAWRVAQTTGFISDTGNYGPQYLGVQPTQSQYTDALTHTVISFTHITPAEVALNYLSAQIDDLLNQDQPICLSFNLRQGFIDGTGINSGAILGGHAVTVVGDKVTLGSDGILHHVLKCASWGPQYGNNGYYNLDLQASFGNQTTKVDLISLDSINGFNGQNLHGDSNAVSIAELYNSLLLRAPETLAFSNVSSALSSGNSLEDVAGWILNSKECQKVISPTSSNSDFVNFLFHSVQGRDPLQAGHDFWTNYLDNGGSRAHLTVQMIQNTQDTSEWAYNIFVGTNQALRTASDFLYNRATASIDLGLHMQDTADTSDHAALLHTVLTNVTSDPNSVQVALIGMSEALGHVILQ